MTTLYRPVLVESAEQAAALPEKAVLVFASATTGEVWSSSLREDVFIDEIFPQFLGETVTALVSIEAREETADRWDEGDPVNDITTKHRYITPWEES